MKLDDYADTIRCYIHIVRYPQQEGRWSCSLLAMGSLYSLDTKENEHDPFLTGTYGSGTSPMEAMNDYCQKISGKLLVLNRYDGNKKKYVRETFGVPSGLFV